MSQSTTIELFRKALMCEHRDDWTMETISEAAHICARALETSPVHKTLKGDTPEEARKRYRAGGFGVYGSPSAKATFERYMKLFDEGERVGEVITHTQDTCYRCGMTKQEAKND